jgi:hypothetical protein
MHHSFMCRMTTFLVIVLMWAVLAACTGIIGTGIGPGIAMVFYSLVFGACGAIVSSIERASAIKLALPFGGIVIAFLSTAAVSILFSAPLNTLPMVAVFLFLFFLIPAYLIHCLVRFTVDKMDVSVVA